MVYESVFTIHNEVAHFAWDHLQFLIAKKTPPSLYKAWDNHHFKHPERFTVKS